MNGAAFDRHGVEVVREFAETPPVRVEKHKVLQILINVHPQRQVCGERILAVDRSGSPSASARNGKRPGEDRGRRQRHRHPRRRISRAFSPTASRRRETATDSACTARRWPPPKWAARLIAQSDGPGQGATFTLELPMDRPARQLIRPWR